MDKDIFDIASYDYDLPQELIAQLPSDNPEDAKLLICEIDDWNLKLQNSFFKTLPTLLSGNEVIFFNNSKVIKSRVLLDNAQIIDPNWNEKQFKWEIFFLKQIDEQSFDALVNPGRKLKIWTKIIFEDISFEIIDISEDGRIIQASQKDFLSWFEQNGIMPLPPYIAYDKSKEAAYQPVFAQTPWSVASPTASLHFTDKLISEFEKNWIKKEFATLHIWLGTFKVVDKQDIRDYDIHSETVEIDFDIFEKIAQYKQQNKTILWVGTTITRTLESLPYLYQMLTSLENQSHNVCGNATHNFPLRKKETAMQADNTPVILSKTKCSEESKKNGTRSFAFAQDDNFKKAIPSRDEIIKNIDLATSQKYIQNIQIIWNKITFETKIFIYPWFKFKIVDELITNFHLPKSSLLMMIWAFMWYENMLKTYDKAITEKYRFYSFGDGMRIKFS